MILLLLFLDIMVPVLDNRPVEITRFSFQRNREHHGGIWPDDLDGPPPIGQKLFALAELLDEDDIADIQLWLVDVRDKRVIAPLGFVRISERNYCGWATVPSEPFRVRAEGHYLDDGKKFHAISAAQTPVARKLPPELPGSFDTDEKYRKLTASPAPIPVPHAQVLSMRHRVEGNRLRLDYEIEVIGADAGFNFWPRVNGPSKFQPMMSPQKLAVGRHHLSFEVTAPEGVKAGHYSIGLVPTGSVHEVDLP